MKRGRKSAADLAVVQPFARQHPAAPIDLTAEQAEVWDDTVKRFPADWFGRETWPLLAAYCRHVITARSLSLMVDNFNPQWITDDYGEGLKRFDRLTALRERETRALIAAARALRLTKASQIRPETAGRQGAKGLGGPRPWEDIQRMESEG